MIHNQIRNVVMTTLLTATVALVPGVGRAQDQPLDKRTIMTFSGPVELPGVALQAGQYVFHLADATSGRKLIQVTSMDGKKVYGTFFSSSIELPQAPGKPEVRFMEPLPGSPAAVRAFWWANERIGSEFIYPRQQAMRLAKSAKEPVLTTTANSEKLDASNTGDLTRVSGTGQNSAADSASARSTSSPTTSSTVANNQARGQSDTLANTTSRTPGSVTPARSTPGSSTPVDRTPRQMARNRTALPQTASSRPAIAVLGMLAVAFACATRIWSTKIG